MAALTGSLSMVVDQEKKKGKTETEEGTIPEGEKTKSIGFRIVWMDKNRYDRGVKRENVCYHVIATEEESERNRKKWIMFIVQKYESLNIQNIVA
jgi:hypothetical protein